MPSRDPRAYVKAVPLPITSQKGLKLQARSQAIYNPTTPTRDEVRKWNYDRRMQQMTDQGFYAYNYKPYKGLGDPFYLDEKKLILHSLGQWDENQEWESSSSSEDDEDIGTSMVVAPQATSTAAKFVLRRTRKDLNTLNKEVVKGRHLIRNVRLGHGLFDMIRQERQAKKAALMAEKKKSLEAARNQWQPPKDSSSEEDSDDDLAKDEDLEHYFGPSLTDNLSEDYDMAVAPSVSASDMAVRSKTSSAKTRSSGKKKKQLTPRPFTPQHTNLTEVTEQKEDISREIGGSKISAKRAREERRAEADWERWLNNQQMGRVNKKGSITRINRMSRVSRLTSHPRVSLQSTSVSPSSSSSQVNAGVGPQPVAVSQKDTSAESRAVTPQEADEEETLHRTGLFKFLDEYYDSLRRETEEERRKEMGAESPTPQGDPNQQTTIEEGSHHKKKKSREGRSKKSKSAQDRQKTPEKHPRYDSPEDRIRSRFILKDLRNDFNYKPKSSAELIEFHATKASNKYANLRQDLHNKFKEVHDDKAMTLHDILEQMERERLTKCQNKFSGLHTRSMSFHRAVEEMRKEGERMIARPEDMRRQSSIKGNWYTDLLQSLPYEVKDIWYYRTILQKLGKYGLPRAKRVSIHNALKQVENTSKQSVYKFLKVLEGLRHWEICSPDISAAIEFCRARIVDMSVDEYEEWFSQAFPKVLRPKTAPAGIRGQGQSSGVNQVGQGSGGDSGGVSGGVMVTFNGSKGGNAQGGPASVSGGSIRLNIGSGRGGAPKSAVSVANGAEGRRRMVQSAVVRR